MAQNYTSNDKVNIAGEHFFALHQLSSVAEVEEVVNAVRIHPNRPRGGPVFRHFVRDFQVIVALVACANCGGLVAEWRCGAEGLEFQLRY